jgi:hypothetical protein
MPRRRHLRSGRRARRVYFIGAGFSKPLGYPLGAELLLELVRRLSGRRKRNNEFVKRKFKESSEWLLQSLEDFLRMYMGYDLHFRRLSEATLASELAKIDQAEFYSVLHTMAEAPELFRDRSVSQLDHNKAKRELLDAAQMFAAVAAATRSYFVDVCWTRPLEMPKYFKNLLKGFQTDHEAIVTFNWDEEVEGYISEQMGRGDPAIAYTFQSWSNDRPYLILKPHGSICWYDLQQGIGNDEPYFVAGGDPRLTRREMRLVTFYEYDAPVDIDGNYHLPLACPPVITPPTFSKRFDYAEQQLIWRDVVDVCADATEFVFLGYSLLTDDYLTRAAIRRAISRSGKMRGRHVKYLIVSKPAGAWNAKSDDDMAPPPHLKSQFERVFQVCQSRHFLPWVFGQEPTGKRLREEIDRKIEDAFI